MRLNVDQYLGQKKLVAKENLKHLKATTAARERMKSGLRIAREMQMSMLPARQSVVRGQPGIDLAAVLEPARQGGADLYDYFMVSPDRFCFLVGGVSVMRGPAAPFMARCKAILRSAACKPGAIPDTILAEANRELIEGNEPTMFITVSLGVLDLRTGELTLCKAGHLPPVLLSRDGRCELIEPQPGTALGITGLAHFAIRRIVLKPGDGLLLITDGVTQVQGRNAGSYGHDRLMASLRDMDKAENADRVVNAVLDDIRIFAEGTPQSDDIAILFIRYLGPPTFSRSLRIGPAASPSRIIQLLDEVESYLGTSRLSEETILDLRVVLEELLINVLRHGSARAEGKIEVGLELVLQEESLLATVTDSGPPFDPLEVPTEQVPKTLADLEMGGRGLHLVRGLMDELEYQRLDGRNVLRMMKSRQGRS